MSQKAWDGRFSEKTDRGVESFTASIDVDKRLYAYDLEGSIAHCIMLAKAGIITEAEAAELVKGLRAIRKEIEGGVFQFDDSLEDIHMHIEARLAQNLGPVAAKLHTARSRNDQVALDVRMYLRDETAAIIGLLNDLRMEIVSLAKSHLAVIMPGYTHLQRAQPVLLSHHLMAYYEMFSRDVERFQGCHKRINVLPLGSAALAGTTYPIDRQYTAKLLGFPAVSANSMDTVSDRDFILEFLSCASICMVHFSRISEELVLWSAAEFGFVEIPDAFATGSSIMPQKKNPDVPELVRGKAGRVFGNLTALLTIMKGLPLAYNRDMQEDKAPLFDTVDTLSACLRIYIAMLPRLRFKQEVMLRATRSGFLDATDLADYLVNRGMSFRQAHATVGKAVGYGLSKGKELHELSLPELKRFSDLIEEDIYRVLATDQMVNRRSSAGGTATIAVKKAIARAEKQLSRAVRP